MSAPLKPWENSLQNSGQVMKSVGLPKTTRTVPVLPPRPQTMGYNSGYSPYSSYGSSYGGYGSGYNSYGGFGSMPYRGSMFGGYNSYGGYGSGYGMYGMGGGYGSQPINDAETRFIQFAEERSRNTFASVESVVRAFNSMAMMLDNTFFAMTSSFRAILGVAENFGRLRSTFGHIWHALNVFRLVKWMYRKLLEMVGVKVATSARSQAWREALTGSSAEAVGSGGSSWSAIAFLGMILSAPYLISKFLPKYEDNLDPELWKANSIPAVAVYPFASQSPNELSFQENEPISIAPKSIQDEMKLTNSGWAYATCNGRSGVVPLTYIKVSKKKQTEPSTAPPKRQQTETAGPKQKRRVSFGENQVFEIEENTNDNDTFLGSTNERVEKVEKKSSLKSDNNDVPQINVANDTEDNLCKNVASSSGEVRGNGILLNNETRTKSEVVDASAAIEDNNITLDK